jgi:tRNA 2-thiouridine synthesizing protein A
MGLFGSKKKDSSDNTENQVETITLENGESYETNAIVNCLGFSCPRPQLMTKAASAKASSGDIICIKVDNPTSMESLQTMESELECKYIGTLFSENSWKVIMRKD